MPETLDYTSVLIFIAVGTYVLGFLFRSQIYIRLLVLIGCFAYMAYYLTAGPEPLWDAFAGAALIGLACLQGMVGLWWSRQPASLRREDREVWRLMGDIEPGLFKQLLKYATVVEFETPELLTQEGRQPDALWFLLDGDLTLLRTGQPDMILRKSVFIGEIAWVSRGTASATVRARKGARLLKWSVTDLRRMLRRNHRLETALEALIAQDLARKLSNSSPIPRDQPDGGRRKTL